MQIEQKLVSLSTPPPGIMPELLDPPSTRVQAAGVKITYEPYSGEGVAVCLSFTLNGIKKFFNSHGALLKMEERVDRNTTHTYVYTGRAGREKLVRIEDPEQKRVFFLAEGERCPPDMRMPWLKKGESP